MSYLKWLKAAVFVTVLFALAHGQPEEMPVENVEAPPRERPIELALEGRDFAPAGETVVPRYRFEVGQKLVYEARSRFEHEGGEDIEFRTLTVWVTDENPDGVAQPNCAPSKTSAATIVRPQDIFLIAYLSFDGWCGGACTPPHFRVL